MKAKAKHAIIKYGHMHEPAEGHYIDCRCGRIGGLFRTKDEAKKDHYKHVEEATKEE